MPVICLPGADNLPQEPNGELVRVLQDFVERAQAGQLQSFISTGFTRDGMRLSTWVDSHNDIYQMLGSLAWIQHEYVWRHTK